MEATETVDNQEKAHFREIVKRTYDKGQNETELTLEKVMEDLKKELKLLLID